MCGFCVVTGRVLTVRSEDVVGWVPVFSFAYVCKIVVSQKKGREKKAHEFLCKVFPFFWARVTIFENDVTAPRDLYIYVRDTQKAKKQ